LQRRRQQLAGDENGTQARQRGHRSGQKLVHRRARAGAPLAGGGPELGFFELTPRGVAALAERPIGQLVVKASRLEEVLAWQGAARVYVTSAGKRTGITASRAARGGWVLDLSA